MSNKVFFNMIPTDYAEFPVSTVTTSRALGRACELLMADWIEVGNPATLDMVDLLRRLQIAIDDCDYQDSNQDSVA